MRLFQLKKSIRNIRRYREITGILLKYGFDDVIDQLKFDLFIKKKKSRSIRKGRTSDGHQSRPERVRLALEELGPTFIKFGQMLSTRYDLMPLAYLDELRKLQDEVSPFPVDSSFRIIEAEFGASVKQLFKHFEEKPMAAASMAQVHRAQTHSGDQVVVKIQRPDIQVLIATDIRILEHLAVLMEKYIPESHVFDPTGLVSQYKSWINEELNFIQEGRNVHRFKKNFQEDESVYVPEVYWELTTERVLTMEYIDGIYIDKTEDLKKAGMDPVLIAQNGTLFIMRQIFDYHFFHGDPHPSNLLVLPNHVIAPLDYGLMGRMDNVLVGQVGDLLRGIIKYDVSIIVRTLMNLNRYNTEVNRDDLRIDVSDLLARYHSVPVNMLKFEHFFNDLVKLIRKNKIQFPRSLYLMGKSLMIIETIAQKLDPDYNVVESAKKFFTHGMIGRAEAEKFLRRSALMIEDYSELMVEAPHMLKQILKKARSGDIGINLHHMRIDDMIKEIDRFANRLSFSLIIASLIVGSSLIIRLERGPLLWELPVFGLIGYTLAGFLGLWLVFSILRSGDL